MLSNAYFLAEFRFDTAENEPAKNLQNFRKMHFRKMDLRSPGRPRGLPPGPDPSSLLIQNQRLQMQIDRAENWRDQQEDCLRSELKKNELNNE